MKIMVRNMMTDTCANVLCKMTAKGLGPQLPQLQNLDKDRNLCLLPPRLILQCDVIDDEKGMNMMKNDSNDKNLTIMKIDEHDEKHDK